MTQPLHLSFRTGMFPSALIDPREPAFTNEALAIDGYVFGKVAECRSE